MKLLYFISVNKIHTLCEDLVLFWGQEPHVKCEPSSCGLTLSGGHCSVQKPKDPEWGLHKEDSKLALTPACSRGTGD